MRIRKNQHPFLHALALGLTGGMSALPSAAMMGTKAVRNGKADREIERHFPTPAKTKKISAREMKRRWPNGMDFDPAANFRAEHVPGSQEYKDAHS